MVDIYWITDEIASSQALSDKDIPYIKEEGFDIIIDVRSEDSDNQRIIDEVDMEYMNISVDENGVPDFEQLDDLFNLVEPAINKGKKILIHSQYAHGRSPLLAAIILIEKGLKTEDALNLVRESNPKVDFSNKQLNFVNNNLRQYFKSKG